MLPGSKQETHIKENLKVREPRTANFRVPLCPASPPHSIGVPLSEGGSAEGGSALSRYALARSRAMSTLHGLGRRPKAGCRTRTWQSWMGWMRGV